MEIGVAEVTPQKQLKKLSNNKKIHPSLDEQGLAVKGYFNATNRELRSINPR